MAASEATIEDKLKEKLKVGQYGYSLEAIALGKRGEIYFEGERIVVKAGAAVRKWAEVIVITKVPEVTVIETWGVFPLSYELAAQEGSYEIVGENTPLPVTMGSKAVTWTTIEATAIENTLIIAPSTSAKKIRVHSFSMSSKQNAVADVGMRFGESGTIKFRFGLSANGGGVAKNLLDACWEGAAGETLYAYLVAAYASGVYFNVGYTEE